jgi:hypothetical protein
MLLFTNLTQFNSLRNPVILGGHFLNYCFLYQIDIPLLDAFWHFNCEYIPEHVLHVKGAGAHGYFLPTVDLSKYTIVLPSFISIGTAGIFLSLFSQFH